VVVFEFQAGEFIRIQRGLERVVVDVVEFEQIRLIVDGRGIVDDDLPLALRAWQKLPLSSSIR